MVKAWGRWRMARPRKSPWQKALADGRVATALLFLPPALMLFSFFVVLPLAEGGSYAGYKWSGYGEPTEWVERLLQEELEFADAAQLQPLLNAHC